MGTWLCGTRVGLVKVKVNIGERLTRPDCESMKEDGMIGCGATRNKSKLDAGHFGQVGGDSCGYPRVFGCEHIVQQASTAFEYHRQRTRLLCAKTIQASMGENKVTVTIPSSYTRSETSRVHKPCERVGP